MKKELTTEFLSPERDDPKDLLPLAKSFKQSLAAQLLDTLPLKVFVINERRQGIYCNDGFRAMANEAGVNTVLGLRPGEALGCVHAQLLEGGCGTTRFCRQCGAAIAILESFRGAKGLEECLLQRCCEGQEEALVLQVFASPFTYEGEDFVLFSALDIRHEKRVREMERLVFHKLLNNASGMVMLTNLIADEGNESMTEYTGHLRGAAQGLMELIHNQQVWMAAEEGRLTPVIESVRPDRLLRQVLLDSSGHDSERNWDCSLDCSCEGEIQTDPDLLGLVLTVLLENAFEAESGHNSVVLGCREEGERILFSVSNEGVPSKSVQHQLFKRSFSTKGDDRGFGLHRARLIVDHCLNGTIDFSCTENRIIFTVDLPRQGPQQ